MSIFFLLISNWGQLTNHENLNFQILSNEINKHSTRNWYKMNWFSKREREREREISLSTVRHHPHFDSWDQYNQERWTI